MAHARETGCGYGADIAKTKDAERQAHFPLPPMPVPLKEYGHFQYDSSEEVGRLLKFAMVNLPGGLNSSAWPLLGRIDPGKNSSSEAKINIRAGDKPG